MCGTFGTWEIQGVFNQHRVMSSKITDCIAWGKKGKNAPPIIVPKNPQYIFSNWSVKNVAISYLLGFLLSSYMNKSEPN